MKNLAVAVWTALAIGGVFALQAEYRRLGTGFQMDLLKASSGKVLRSKGFTHGAGPPFSISVNGEMSDLRYHYRSAVGEGEITFGSSPPVRYELASTLKEYEREFLGDGPKSLRRASLLIDAEGSFVLTRDFLSKQPRSKDGSFTVRLSGVYFVAYLKLVRADSFPASGTLSLIVN